MVVLLAGSPNSSVPVFADEDDQIWEDDDDSHDRARHALSQGEVLPVSELLKIVQEQIKGEVVGMEFEREHNRWVYEFRIINDVGRLIEVYVDAKTGTILSAEED